MRLNVGECDCCGAKASVLHHGWASGIETYACAICCGADPEDDEAALADQIADEEADEERRANSQFGVGA